MEFVLVLVVIAVLCLILGVKLSYLIFAAAALAALIIAASELLLTVFFIRPLYIKATATFLTALLILFLSIYSPVLLHPNPATLGW